ncbi:MAG: hypothetical protein J3T61_11220, partial [Candidatus Brocadiales bacterium]|nr:hypothetical protein [Candidatus Bathyanammoxibius sp.]
DHLEIQVCSFPDIPFGKENDMFISFLGHGLGQIFVRQQDYSVAVQGYKTSIYENRFVSDGAVEGKTMPA